MMTKPRQVLIEEIRQITAQYRAEVPGRRKAWPNAVKQRVVALRELGMSFKAICDQTELPYFTVLGWRDRDGEFKQLATVTVPAPRAEVNVPGGNQDPSPVMIATATVTVTTPLGYRIEGLTASQVIQVLERLR